MPRNLRLWPRTLLSITWPVWLIAALAIVAASCSGSDEQAQLVDPEAAADEVAEDSTNGIDADDSNPTAPPATEPDSLAFGDAPQTLRVSVESLAAVAPSELDETNVVQVLVTDLLTDGLTRRNPADGSIEPAIAESWTTSEDGLLWTFQLGDAAFSNGETIDADDVVSSLTTLAAQGLNSVSALNLWPVLGWAEAGEVASSSPLAQVQVAGITAVGDDLVEFSLSEPFAPLDEVLAGVSFGIAPADAPAGVVSSAVDFTVDEEWTDGVRVVGEQGDGEISTIEILVDPDFTMFEAGESDLAIGNVDADRLPEGATQTDVERAATSYFAMNTAIAPFDDPQIRQAVVHAVDSDVLLVGQFEGVVPMRSFIPEQIPGGVVDACGDACQFDVERASTLVEASPSSDTEITIDFFDDGSPDNADGQVASALAQSLVDVGLSASAVGHTAEEFAAGVIAGEFGIFRFGSVSTTLSAESLIGLQFHTDGRDNITSTSIPRVDELIDEARTTLDADERAALYASAEQLLFAEAAVLPLMEFRQPLAFSENLATAGLEPDGSLNLSQIEFDSDGTQGLIPQGE